MHGHPQVDVPAHESVGHAVAVPFEFDVVVGREFGALPLSVDVALQRERSHDRPVDLLELLVARGVRPLHESVVQLLQVKRDCVIQFFQTEEDAVS